MYDFPTSGPQFLRGTVCTPFFPPDRVEKQRLPRRQPGAACALRSTELQPLIPWPFPSSARARRRQVASSSQLSASMNSGPAAHEKKPLILTLA